MQIHPGGRGSEGGFLPSVSWQLPGGAWCGFVIVSLRRKPGGCPGLSCGQLVACGVCGPSQPQPTWSWISASSGLTTSVSPLLTSAGSCRARRGIVCLLQVHEAAACLPISHSACLVKPGQLSWLLQRVPPGFVQANTATVAASPWPRKCVYSTWYVSDLPPPAGNRQRTSRPWRVALTTSRCSGLSGV